MKINKSIKIELTKKEVLEALTSHIQDEVKYKNNFDEKYQEALDFVYGANGMVVIWGEPPEEEPVIDPTKITLEAVVEATASKPVAEDDIPF